MSYTRLVRFAALPLLALTLSTGAFAAGQQPAPAPQHTDGESPTQVGPGSQAFKQQTDGESPTQVGPGSQAFKQQTDGEAPTQVGPGSGAYRADQAAQASR